MSFFKDTNTPIRTDGLARLAPYLASLAAVRRVFSDVMIQIIITSND